MVLVLVLVLVMVLLMVLVMVLVVNAPLSLLFILSTTSSSGRGAVTGIREHKQQLIPKIRSILAIWVKRAAPMLPKIRSLLTRKNLGKGCGLVRDLTSKIFKNRTFEDSYKLLFHHHQLRPSSEVLMRSN